MKEKVGKKGDGGEKRGREEKREGKVKRAEGRREREDVLVGWRSIGMGAPQLLRSSSALSLKTTASSLKHLRQLA